MYFPTLHARLRRWLAFELFQGALWVALVLRTLAGLRSAFGGGGPTAALRSGKAIRPRRFDRPLRGRAVTHPAA